MRSILVPATETRYRPAIAGPAAQETNRTKCKEANQTKCKETITA